MSQKIRIACISDTHDIFYPTIPSDVAAVLHAGDISLSGSEDETLRFLRWFEDLPIKHKIFVGGNHDRWLEMYGAAILPDYPSITMLFNSSYDLEGYKVWGSPVSPRYGHICAFAKEREDLEEGYWTEHIPMDTDILVTHSPAQGIGDQVRFAQSEHLGDKGLQDCLELLRPRLHVYGHIHGGHGNYGFLWRDGSGRFMNSVNAAVLNEAYSPWPDPTVTIIELAHKPAEDNDGDGSGDERL